MNLWLLEKTLILMLSTLELNAVLASCRDGLSSTPFNQMMTPQMKSMVCTSERFKKSMSTVLMIFH